jgi:aconitate hydratase
LNGKLPSWVTSKDIILELLRRLTVQGGLGKIFEFGGPGVKTLSIPERATIANLGAELGVTTTLFPSDEKTLEFLRAQGRRKDWFPLEPDPDAAYGQVIEMDLSKLEPLIAQPSSPDNVCPVRDVAGKKVNQVCIGSCNNSSYMDLMSVARILKGRKVHPNVSFTITPGSKQVYESIARNGALGDLIRAGARILESACGPCIGMGQAPPSEGISIRTMNRNFSGRSGTPEDRVYLASPYVASACALKGVIIDPRRLGPGPPRILMPKRFLIDDSMILPPSSKPEKVVIERGPNIKPLPTRGLLEDFIEGSVLLKVGDNITTRGKYRKRFRTTNGVERLNEEIRRRERVIRIFPNRESVIRLMGAYLMEIDEKWASGRRYLEMEEYHEWRKTSKVSKKVTHIGF